MLSRYRREAPTVFDLLGRNEVALTAALGWGLSQAHSLLEALTSHLDCAVEASHADITLEDADVHGRTDLEITTSTTKVIIEAKQGWLVPGEEQLSKYSRRFDGFDTSLMVSLSDSSFAWAHAQLPAQVGGVPVKHVSWDEVRTIIARSKLASNGKQRWWLDELEKYMGQATATTSYDDQWVFCVVVSNALLGPSTFRDYVSKERIYFHPYGGNNGWPKKAPNFLCFRWKGKVQQVNRVSSVEVVPQLSDKWPGIGDNVANGPHIVYKLGQDIPIPTVRTTGTYASGRVWCLLDQLLVQPTLADAVRTSKELSAN